MSENLIPFIANKLGVELGEEFKVEGLMCKYRFSENDLEYWHYDYQEWRQSEVLMKIVTGRRTIIKLSFEPKEGESYWTYFDEDLQVKKAIWGNKPIDYLRKNYGCVFRTEDEAIAARPAKYKELTGKEWEK